MLNERRDTEATQNTGEPTTHNQQQRKNRQPTTHNQQQKRENNENRREEGPESIPKGDTELKQNEDNTE